MRVPQAKGSELDMPEIPPTNARYQPPYLPMTIQDNNGRYGARLPSPSTDCTRSKLTLSSVVIVVLARQAFKSRVTGAKRISPGKISLIGDEPGLPYQRPRCPKLICWAN